MSTVVRYDSLLVRVLAAELDATLRGRRVRSVRFERAALRVSIGLKAAAGQRTLVLDLAPRAGWIRLLDQPPPPGNVALPRGTRVQRVASPPDERLLIVELAGSAEARLVVELMTNQWNALLIAADARILRALRPRGGERAFRPGLPYSPPPPSGRQGAAAPLTEDAWRALLQPVEPQERARALVASVAFTSPLNSAYVLGEAASSPADDALASAYARYRALLAEPARPALLATPHGAQPYPHPLDSPAQPCASLLACFALAAEAGGAAAADDAGALLARARHQAERLRRRSERLRTELQGAAQEADRLRADADLLLAQLPRVRRGAAEIELDDFAGGTRRVALDPATGPAENAERLYAAARKRDRAAARLPAMIERARADAAALDAWADARERDGTDAGEPPVPLQKRPAQASGRSEPNEPRLPYRAFATSGGLEVRVGRSGRANDELTLRHAAPNDIWLHARDVAGAHVVLRWTDPQANPPQRDLVEAAVLAALHSRSRTSGVVAVDWTRRKYVRKPRGARPGLVTLERAKTIFVEPDPAVAERLSER